MLMFVGLLILAFAGHAFGECSGGCKEPTLLYDGLKCSPRFLAPDDCCPVEYDCSHIEAKASLNEEKCYFHGKTYDQGENINNDETYGNCQVSCTCRKKSSGNIGFTCAVLDCPEWLGRRPKLGCYLKYELNKCCSVGDACPPYSATCEVEVKTYHEGNRFDAPNKKCTKCVCQQGFKGEYEAPFCKKRECTDEISHQKEVKQFCAPSYISLDDCCPYNWICPEDSDKIVPSESSASHDVQCKFGDKKLNIGDKFERTSDNSGKLSCECRLPPYLTCIQNYEYPSYASEY